MAQTGKSAESAGFTLLELMIALGLTSLLSLVAYSALSLSLKAMQHGQAAAEQVQELRVAQTILARFGFPLAAAGARLGYLGNKVNLLMPP